MEIGDVMDQLNPHGEWRLDAARQIAHRLRNLAGLRAIVVAGSVARGYADEYSDLELPLFWDEPPSDATRHAIIHTLQADLLHPYNGPAQEDNLLINGFQVDLWQNTVAFEEDTLNAVLQRYSTDLGASNFMDTVRSCIPLAGDELIATWKQRASAYPEPLAVRNIQEQLPHLEIGHLMIHAARDNPALVYASISELQQYLFLILLALNHTYFPGPKWLYRSIEALPIKPIQAARRMKQVFHLAQAQAVDETINLLREALALVERYHPQINTTPTRLALEPQRMAHPAPVRLYQDDDAVSCQGFCKDRENVR
ncbi:MAG TPA: nucleotidyltransferase domain-containing protein [Anaerolineae bacterium]